MKPQDELLERYAQAKASLDDGLPNEPPAALHERIMQVAREQENAIYSVAPHANSMPATSPKVFKNATQQTTLSDNAANDGFWNIKAVASIAVMGLSALIWWQFEQGTPEEQEATKTAQPSPEVVAIAPPASPAASTEASAVVAAAPKQETIAPAPGIEKKSAVGAPVQIAKEAARPAAEFSAAAPAAPAPVMAERARSQEAAAAPQAESAHAVTADAAPLGASAKGAAPAPASRTLSAEASSAMGAPPAIARPSASPPVAAAPAARAAAPAPMAAAAPPNPVLLALQSRDAAALRQALAEGASPNVRTRDGNPGLTQAVIQRWPEGARILLEAGADRNAKNNKGHTAADVALELGDTELVQLLAAPR